MTKRQKLAQALAGLQEPEPEARWQACVHLARLGSPEAIAGLLRALEDPAPKVRAAAALYLGVLKAEEALPALIHHLREDASAHVRLMVASCLDTFQDSRAVEPLIERLEDPDWKMLTAAALGLGLIGDKRAVPALFPLLHYPHWRVRHAAAWALIELGASDARLVAAIEQLAREPEAEEHEAHMAGRRTELEEMTRHARAMGDPAPKPGLAIAELLAEARRLASSVEVTGKEGRDMGVQPLPGNQTSKEESG
jgi:HEAT repeat protein